MAQEYTLAAADFLALEDIERFQRQQWKSQISYVMQHSAFYQQYFKQYTFTGNLKDISDLPLTDKEMLHKDQHIHAPFGSYLAAADKLIRRIHRSSGTSGSTMNLVLTERDARMAALVGARAQSAAGLGPGYRVVHCLNYRLWMGGYTDHASLEATGAMVVPYGVGGTIELIDLIRHLKIDAISCTPSYPAVLEQVIAIKFPGLKPRDLGLRLGLFGGEAGLDDAGFRRRLKRIWGFDVRNSNYGVTDVLSNFAGQTSVNNDLHFVALDVLYPELIDPHSGISKPWKEGESGELVLTHLCKQAQPLVRFRTGDIIVLTGLDKAACGRSAPRFRVIGRGDDMVVVRGINVFPTMIAEVINSIDGVTGEYRIYLDHKPPYDYLPIEIEWSGANESGHQIAFFVEAKIKQALGISARVKLCDAHSLPRTEGKTRRVIRNFKT